MRIRTRLFWSYVAVLLIGGLVAFLAAEAIAPVIIDRRQTRMEHHMERHMEHHMGRERRGMGMPMPMPDHNDLLSAAVQDLTAEYRGVMQHSLLLGLAGALGVAGAASLLLSRKISAPLQRMQSASDRIAQGAYHQRLEEAVPGEVGELAAAFNRMASELENTEQRRSSLIANVAHEFRTPLSGLQGYLEGLADGHFGVQDGTVEACLRQVGRLRRLVEELSLLSRVEAGVAPFEPRVFNPVPLLEHTVRDYRARFEAKGVRLELKSDADCGAAYADPDRTGQVLENLLSNALRHTPKGGTVTVAATRRPAQHAHEAEPQIEIAVVDTGEGMASEVVPHVFERFYRAEASRTRDEARAGTGIGLTLAKAFVEAQGGTVSVESAVGAGTTVRFTVPSAGPSTAEADSGMGGADAAGGGAGAGGVGGDPKAAPPA